ncbi:lysin A [Mycobacterium phage Funsized]|nr:lysin A [Mycobacterium phage Funsized]
MLGAPMENGWPECDLSDTERLTIPGTPLSLPIREGQPHAIMQAFFRDVNEFIEPANNSRGYSDEGSWTDNNSVYTSNHKGATAVDWNWDDHPMGRALAGWDGSVLINGSQEPAMRELLAWYEGMIFWGNDWNSPKDSMHFQMGYNTCCGGANAARVQSFIDRKIRADGFSTYRRGGVPRGGGTAVAPSAPANPIPPVSGLTGAVLWDIAGRPARMSVARYDQLLPRLVACLDACGCNTIDRRAMWFAQVFHESGALFYTEEIASGDAYDTRTDLGNTPQVDGDGRLYKGRSFIQVTGKSNYAKLSGWAFEHGYVPTRDYFVVNPDRLDDDEFAFLGVTWYWTTQRPMNDAADARNLELATRYVNGGLNGLDDRRAIYNRALAHNAELLGGPTSAPPDPWEELMSLAVPSLSIYANPGEPDVPLATMIAGIDAHGPHEPFVENLARQGDIDSIRRVARTAAGLGKFGTDARAVNQATKVLNEIYATNPAFIVAAKQ